MRKILFYFHMYIYHQNNIICLSFQLGTHSRNTSVSDAESRRVAFHACPCKNNTSCDVQGGGSCVCKKGVQVRYE